MATATQISFSEYLSTSYRPDMEYVDGEVRERNVGKWEHSRIQAILAGWFREHRQAWSVVAATELRVKVAPNRVRIPDVTVTTTGPKPDVLSEPPLLVIEILSPDDSFSDTITRSQDYMAMGVNTVWVIDPRTRAGHQYSGATWVGTSRLTVPGTEIYADMPQIFQEINE